MLFIQRAKICTERKQIPETIEKLHQPSNSLTFKVERISYRSSGVEQSAPFVVETTTRNPVDQPTDKKRSRLSAAIWRHGTACERLDGTLKGKKMFAVFKTGGKQYRVVADDLLKVGKLAGEPGEIVEFNEVLMVGEGAKAEIGAPTVEGALVTAEVVEQGRARKVIAFKKRRRQNSRRTIGHRQHFTTLRISEILTGGAKPSKKAAAKPAAKKADAKPAADSKAEAAKADVKADAKAEAKPAAKKADEKKPAEKAEAKKPAAKKATETKAAAEKKPAAKKPAAKKPAAKKDAE